MIRAIGGKTRGRACVTACVTARDACVSAVGNASAPRTWMRVIVLLGVVSLGVFVSFVSIVARRMPASISVCLFIMAIGASPVAFGQDATAGEAAAPTLTLGEAQALALAADPAVASRQSTARAHAERAAARGALPAPQLRARLLNVPSDDWRLDREPNTQLSLGLSQRLPRGNTRALRRAQSEARATASRAEAELTAAERRLSVAHHWLSALEAERTRALLAEQQQLLIELEAATETAYRVGRATQRALTLLQVERARLRERRAASEGVTRASRAELARWIGPAAERPLPRAIPDRLRQHPEAPVGDHPELAALAARLERADLELDEARQGRRPEIAVALDYGYRQSRPDVVSVGVTIDVPLLPLGRQDRLIAAAQADRYALALAERDRRAALEAEARALLAQLPLLDRRIDTHRTEIVPGLERAARLAQGEYQSRETEFETVIAASRAVLEARERLLKLEVERARVIAELRFLAADTLGAAAVGEEDGP